MLIPITQTRPTSPGIVGVACQQVDEIEIDQLFGGLRRDLTMAASERTGIDLDRRPGGGQPSQQLWLSLNEFVALGMCQNRSQSSINQTTDRQLDRLDLPAESEVKLQQQIARFVDRHQLARLILLDKINRDPHLRAGVHRHGDAFLKRQLIQPRNTITNLPRVGVVKVRRGDDTGDAILSGDLQHLDCLSVVIRAIVDARQDVTVEIDQPGWDS